MKKNTDRLKEQITQANQSYEYTFGRRGHSSHSGALLLIFIGALFLLNNLGLLSWNIWNELWKFWPVVIILLGVQMLLGKSRGAGNLITLLTLFVLAGILAYVLVSSQILVLPPIR